MSERKVSIGIHGALGRMGIRLIQLIAEDPSLELAAALVRDGHPRAGRGCRHGGRRGCRWASPLGAAVPAGAAVDVMVDFSAPAAALAIGAWCREQGVPLVVGTTGLEAEHRRELEAASARIPLLIAPNMSRAVNLLMKLVGEAARVLGPAADIEIIERHHRTKKDAPSGTAVRLGRDGRPGRRRQPG